MRLALGVDHLRALRYRDLAALADFLKYAVADKITASSIAIRPVPSMSVPPCRTIGRVCVHAGDDMNSKAAKAGSTRLKAGRISYDLCL